MKTQLTKEQSQHLIDLGVPKEKTSQEDWTSYSPIGVGFRYPIFTLTDLLEVLPKEIEGEEYVEYLRIGYTTDRKWQCYYTCFEDYFYGKELIDALYELAYWTIENGYLKFE